MKLRATIALALAAALFLASCGGDGTNNGSASEDTDAPAATTTTTVPAEYQTVIDARREGHHQYELARANPTNPENPVLRDYFTGVELMNVIRGQVFNNDGNGNGIGARYPDNTQHRFGIGSVTFSGTDPNVAWLETCWIDDSKDYYLNTGADADVLTSILETTAIRTVQRSEEIRKEGGRWKVAKTFTNSYQPGITGCATDDYEQPYSEAPTSSETTQMVTEHRAAAEQSLVDYLTDPNYTSYSDTWTGFQHDHYFANAPFGTDEHKNPDYHYCPSDVTLAMTSPTSGEYRQFYLQDDSLNPWRTDPYFDYDHTRYNESPCYSDYQLGQNAWAFTGRNDGTTLNPSTTSTVTVQHVQLQSTENPHVAYLTTCRTFNLVPNQPGDYPHPQGSVTSVETMHLVDGAWKVSNRWHFANASTCN